MRKPCETPRLPATHADPATGQPVTTDTALASALIAEDTALQICDARRSLAVTIMDMHNQAVTTLPDSIHKKRWWWPFDN